MSNPQDIISQLTRELQKNPFVIGLVLVGSQVRGTIYTANQFSDIEAYIIVEDSDFEPVEKQLPTVVNRLGSVILFYKNRWSGFSAVFENLLRLELPLVKKSELSSVFARPKAQVVKVLINKTDGELQVVLNKRPKKIDFEKLFSETVTDFWYMVTVAVQYYKKEEFWHARHTLQVVLVPLLIKFLELLEKPNILLLESNKYIEQFLPEEKLRLLREISPSYDKQEIRQSLKRIIEIFSDIARKIVKKYQYKYPADIEKKIRPKLEHLLR